MLRLKCPLGLAAPRATNETRAPRSYLVFFLSFCQHPSRLGGTKKILVGVTKFPAELYHFDPAVSDALRVAIAQKKSGIIN